MYIKGIKDYDRNGQERETGLFAGPISQDGELKQTKGGKTYGSVSVRAFNRKDGTAAFMSIKSFQEDTAARLSSLHKGDRILCAGVVESREYNGKTYTDMLVDFLMAPGSQAANRAALESRMAAAGFDTGGGGSDSGFAEIGEEDGELPF